MRRFFVSLERNSPWLYSIVKILVEHRRCARKVLRNNYTLILASPFMLLLSYFLFFLRPILRSITSFRIVVFNMPALGHEIFEFNTFWLSYLQNENPQNTILIYANKTQVSGGNKFFFELAERALSGSNAKVMAVPPVFWGILATVAGASANNSDWIKGSFINYSRFTVLEKSKVQSLFHKEEINELKQLLEKTLPDSSSGFCILAMRDGDYYGDSTSIRNSQIHSWLPAVELLLERGISVIRMGRKARFPMPIQHPRLFDYSFSAEVNDKMDMLLFAHALFAIGDSTGLLDAPFLLGSPSLCVSYPFDPRSFISDPNFYFAVQGLTNHFSGKLLTASEIIDFMNAGINIGDENELRKIGLTSVMPSPIEIRNSIDWFLNIVGNGDSIVDTEPYEIQKALLKVLQEKDLGTFSHYRSDAPKPGEWDDFKSKIYPPSIRHLI